MGIDVGPIQVTDGLVFQFDPANFRSYSGSGTTAYSIAASGAGGSLVNGPTFSSSNNLYYINFDGTNDYGLFTVNLGTNCTIDTWINTTITNIKILWSLNADGYSSGPDIYCNKGVLSWNTGDDVNNAFSNSYYLTAGKWCNLVVTNSSSSNAKLYIDGELIGTANYLNCTTTGTNNFYLGRYDLQSGFESNVKYGKVRIYNRELTSNEIINNFNNSKSRYLSSYSPQFSSAGYTHVSSGLVLYLDPSSTACYSGSGNTLYDLSGNGNNLTNNGTMNLKTHKARCFNMQGNHSTTISTTVLNPTAYTKFIAVFPETNNNYLSGGADSDQAFWGNQGPYLSAGHNGSYATVSYTSEYNLEKWQLAAVTFSTTNGWKLYYNGQQVSTSASTTTFNGNGILRLGAFNAGANLMTGKIGVVLVYNRELTASEIQQNFNTFRERYGL
jgi:hypothetical protein